MCLWRLATHQAPSSGLRCSKLKRSAVDLKACESLRGLRRRDGAICGSKHVRICACVHPCPSEHPAYTSDPVCRQQESKRNCGCCTGLERQTCNSTRRGATPGSSGTPERPVLNARASCEQFLNRPAGSDPRCPCCELQVLSAGECGARYALSRRSAGLARGNENCAFPALSAIQHPWRLWAVPCSHAGETDMLLLPDAVRSRLTFLLIVIGLAPERRASKCAEARRSGAQASLERRRT